MFIRRIFKTKLHAVIGTLAIFTIMNASLQSIFFGSDNEILYDYSTIVFLCLKDSTTCVYISELKLANTGVKTINEISVIFSEIPESLKTSLRVRNLNAGKPRDRDPDVENINLHGDNSIKINNLSPGALVIVKLSGDIPVATKSLLTNLDVSVESEATVINADPQGTEFSRLWSMLL